MRKNNTSIYSNKLYSKYGSQYTFMTEAPLKKIPKPTIEFLRNTFKGNQHLYKIKITPNRSVIRYDIFVNNNVQINNLKANGVQSIDFKSNIASKTEGKLLTYYLVDNLPLELEFSTLNTQNLDLNLVESSFDLYKAARVPYYDVLLSQQNALQTNIELIRIHKRSKISLIQLFKNLGGKW